MSAHPLAHRHAAPATFFLDFRSGFFIRNKANVPAPLHLRKLDLANAPATKPRHCSR
jgi:hypothetical protein